MKEEKSEFGMKLRADAQRNRARLLESAKVCFARSGDAVTLDDIVDHAGVGIGTLYRHFKTRDALIEAVYVSEHELLAERARELESTLPPVEALREWLSGFVDVLATKRTMGESLSTLYRTKPEVYSVARSLMEPTLKRLLERAETSGEIKVDMEPVDLLRALVGITNASAEPNWRENVQKFVDLLVSGMQAKAQR